MVTLFDRTEVVLSCSCHVFLSVCSRPWLPSRRDALQPGCVRPRPATVPYAASWPAAAPWPAAAQRSSPTHRLLSPASIQPGFYWIMDRSATLLATLNVLQHFSNLAELEIFVIWIRRCKLSLSVLIHVFWWWNMRMLWHIWNHCSASVLSKELPSKNVDTSRLALHGLTIYKWWDCFLYIS